MPWFTQDAIDFFRELELNNNKPWFEANKKRYEASVKKPMEAFAGHMIERMKKFDPEIAMTPKDAVFRIYKDVRFSKDKTPYKTNAGAHISRGGRKGFSTPGLYFHFDPRVMGVASGYYMLEPDQIAKIRRLIMSDPAGYEKALGNKAFQTHFGKVLGETNKVMPPEFKEAAKTLPILLNKQFYYWAEQPVEQLLIEDLDDFLIERYQAAVPMNEYLNQAFA